MDEDSVDAYISLCEQLDIAFVGPEIVGGKGGIRADRVRRGACDVLRTGTLDVGGITPVLKIVCLADAISIPLTMHLGGLPSLHILVTMPSGMFEHGLLHPSLPFGYRPAWQSEPSFVVQPDGFIEMPFRPGLGWADRLGVRRPPRLRSRGGRALTQGGT